MLPLGNEWHRANLGPEGILLGFPLTWQGGVCILSPPGGGTPVYKDKGMSVVGVQVRSPHLGEHHNFCQKCDSRCPLSCLGSA